MRMKMLVAVVCLLALAPAARAWNDTGHMTVAMIAWRQLNDTQRQNVSELLRQHPHYKLLLAANVPEGVAEDEWAFLRAAIWADLVRPSRPGTPEEVFKGPEITSFHRGDWHYVEYPWVPAAERKNINPTTLPTHREPNAITAFEDAMKRLRSEDANPQEKAVALTWISHLVGDIHQPLHACTMWSSQYPTGDRGGNEEAVRANGIVMRLHQVWDESLGMGDAYDALVFHAQHILAQPAHEKQNLAELAAHKSFASWTDESHELAIAMAHLNGRLKSMPFWQFDKKQISADDIPSLPPSYLANAHDVAERRIALAGFRLAEQIKRVLKPIAAKPTSAPAGGA